jgi:hypothetical protein
MLRLISLGKDIFVVGVKFESAEPETPPVCASRCVGFSDEILTAGHDCIGPNPRRATWRKRYELLVACSSPLVFHWLDSPYLLQTSANLRCNSPEVAALMYHSSDTAPSHGPGMCRRRQYERNTERRYKVMSTASAGFHEDEKEIPCIIISALAIVQPATI